MTDLIEAAVDPDQGAVEQPGAGFAVRLDNFEGPFDLLLSLIAKHELDITEVSLSAVTDEFISYLRGIETNEDLDRASEFLVVAATLLDLKVVGLLPQGELVDAEDVALLEARDLLFARLLQYRAFKEAARWFGGRIEAEAGRHARTVRLEERFRQRVPELIPETPNEMRRYADALLRREHRETEAARRKAERKATSEGSAQA